jgi:hypothetical protein
VRVTRLTSLGGTIGMLRVRARLGPAAVRDLLARGGGCLDALPADVRAALSHPRILLFAGRVDMLPAQGRAFEVRLHPGARGQSIDFVLAGVTRAGEAQSAGELAEERASSACGRSVGAVPFGARLQSAIAVTGALVVELGATDASFSTF